eukprot:8129127-Karenia_brevis.AAC.1
MELFIFSPSVIQEGNRLTIQAWRRILQLGGRSPVDVVYCLTGLCPWEVESRIRRVGLLLKLMNSPVHSWQHVALVIQFQMQTEWFRQAFSDLQLVLPHVRLCIGEHSQGPFLYSTGWWNEVDAWMCAQAHDLPKDMLGRRFRPYAAKSKDDLYEKSVSLHVRTLCGALRSRLRRDHDSN